MSMREIAASRAHMFVYARPLGSGGAAAACAWRAPFQRACCGAARAATDAAGASSDSGSSSDPSGGSATAGDAAAAAAPGRRAEGSVDIAYRGRGIKVAPGTKLRTALLQAGLTPHNGRAQLINCRGLGTCGTCAVEIRGKVEPAEWTTAEQLRLNFPPHKAPNNARLRLACQVSCAGDLAVVKRSGFWGQGAAVLPELAAGEGGAPPPLGALEYVLDPRARGGGGGGGGGGAAE
ncbi:MAG: hypothetical protein J3K34DRAFT_387226 [Monoraphidium minutum]|nr:MAG: hypothetical protein J3K34DRAFT_387226 [Monoraphidium minutum]